MILTFHVSPVARGQICDFWKKWSIKPRHNCSLSWKTNFEKTMILLHDYPLLCDI